MRHYILTGHDLPKLQLVHSEDPSPGYGEIVVDLRAASLNYRDLLIAQRFSDLVPMSDGTGVVSALGDGVEGHAIGDRVVIAFMPKWLDGDFTEAKRASLGSPGFAGVLTERIVVPATGVVRIPDPMTFEAAATLPCAGVTAWSALFEQRPVQPGETVLLLGTGGVSIFALQLAKMAGACVIMTSSSNEKLERARALGADHLINYRSVPDWENEVLRLTNGIGADLAVDVAGPATLNKTLKATRLGGRISLMGVLTGFDGSVDTGVLLEKRITLQGIYVGPVAALQALVKTNIAPQIDRVFPFEDAEAAYSALQAAGHFGKLVIRIGK
ncbi:NAD(P)-dependent alcohol dehydrogenase [Gluconobacter cerinus]|uniref:zinc-dependent alcohol dehydrogenase family protein n=1 Tax=Gluconobacter cerinus TaxID=38307 RepID=UPI001B8D679F|nr:NAD(P)-dependent alcohol dehydrogenase [Gluconobacter cerinus]MBS1040011.1 NAD(P)-dependent alcohol dehydrogenase [Gluconobacter cerinus]MBS1047022.1 NAD(P)-dependent alcohol dehydrogenase [Gluconobacter cerinus]